MGISLSVLPGADGVAIEADRQVLAAVVTNLLQNAFTFTRPQSTVTLRAGASAERVLIEIEDECGGLARWECRRLSSGHSSSAAWIARAGSGSRVQPMGRGSEPWPDPCAQPARRGCIFTVDLPRFRDAVGVLG